MRSIIMTLLGVLMAISVASAADRPLRDQLAEDSVIEQALKRGTLRVGFSTFVPWAMQDKSGAFVGFEVDVATRLAQDLGLNLELVPTKWSGIIPALLTGKFDVIIGGMSVKPVRSLKVNFTIPYDFRIPDEGMNLHEFVERLVEQALQRCNGNKTRAATLLGLSRFALLRRLRK